MNAVLLSTMDSQVVRGVEVGPRLGGEESVMSTKYSVEPTKFMLVTYKALWRLITVQVQL